MSNWRAGTSIFYGWWLVAALLVILVNMVGVGIYVFPVFIGSLQNEFGWSISQISIAAAIWAMVFGLASPVLGILIERFGVLWTMLASAALASLSYLGYAHLHSLRMLYAVSIVSGFAVAGTTLAPTTALITNWFDKYRGRAMAVAMLGSGVGGFALPPLYEFLIRQLGWRQAWYFALIMLALVFVPLMAVFIRTRPSDLGLLPDGENPAEESQGTDGALISGLSVKRAVSTSNFWLLVAIFVLLCLGPSALTFHFVVFAQEQAHFSSQEAAFYYGLALGFSIAGRLLFGWLADRWKPTLLLAAAGVLMACGPAALELLIVRLELRTASLLWFHAVPYGLGLGGNVVVLPVVISRCFGERHFPKISGLIMTGYALGVIMGIPVAGKIFDRTGSYEIVFIACIIVLIMAAILSLLIDPDRDRKDFLEERTTHIQDAAS